MKKNRILIILCSTLLTLSMIYGISSGKLLTDTTVQAATKDGFETDNPFEGIVSTNSQALPLADDDLELPEAAVEPQKELTVIDYIVKTGDTLDSIAREHNISVNTIAESNAISLSSILKPEQKLSFPSVDGILYSIKKGDSLWELAKKYNIKIDDVLEANKLEMDSKISIDQKVILPGARKAVTYIASKTPSRGSVSASTKTTSSWPAIGTISSGFGWRWGRMHTGIDIAANTGTDVHAFAPGKVTFSGWNGSYGKLVIIDHGDGLESYYAHNSKLLVSVGDKVEKGDHIADVGSTGRSTGPHCHFEIRENGEPVNPASYLK